MTAKASKEKFAVTMEEKEAAEEEPDNKTPREWCCLSNTIPGGKVRISCRNRISGYKQRSKRWYS